MYHSGDASLQHKPTDLQNHPTPEEPGAPHLGEAVAGCPSDQLFQEPFPLLSQGLGARFPG